MINLGIETSGLLCGVAIFDDERFLGECTISLANLHDQKLLALIENLIPCVNLSIDELDMVSVSIGPGSFTGLRIGLAAAKGLCISNDLKISGVNTLDSIAYKYFQFRNFDIDHTVCCLIDAKRDEFYHAFYKYNSSNIIEKISDYRCSDITEILSCSPSGTIFIGDNLMNNEDLNKSTFPVFSSELTFLDPKIICKMGNTKMKSGKLDKIDSLEPFYIKDFIPITKTKGV